MTIKVQGGVIVGGHEYLDNEIKALFGIDVRAIGWDYSGDQSPEEIIVGDKTFSGNDALPRALEYIQQLEDARVVR